MTLCDRSKFLKNTKYAIHSLLQLYVFMSFLIYLLFVFILINLVNSEASLNTIGRIRS